MKLTAEVLSDSTVSKKLHELRKSITCTICLEYFDNPYALPCTHCFCSKCINAHLNGNRNAYCPICKLPATLESVEFDNSVNQLSILVRDFVEQLDRPDGGADGNTMDGVLSSGYGSSVSAAAATTGNLFFIGDLVQVGRRMWPGINKPGGTGRVVKINRGDGPGGGVGNSPSSSSAAADLSYDVRYILDNKLDTAVPPIFIMHLPPEDDASGDFGTDGSSVGMGMGTGRCRTTRNRSAYASPAAALNTTTKKRKSRGSSASIAASEAGNRLSESGGVDLLGSPGPSTGCTNSVGSSVSTTPTAAANSAASTPGGGDCDSAARDNTAARSGASIIGVSPSTSTAEGGKANKAAAAVTASSRKKRKLEESTALAVDNVPPTATANVDPDLLPPLSVHPAISKAESNICTLSSSNSNAHYSVGAASSSSSVSVLPAPIAVISAPPPAPAPYVMMLSSTSINDERDKVTLARFCERFVTDHAPLVPLTLSTGASAVSTSPSTAAAAGGGGNLSSHTGNSAYAALSDINSNSNSNSISNTSSSSTADQPPEVTIRYSDNYDRNITHLIISTLPLVTNSKDKSGNYRNPTAVGTSSRYIVEKRTMKYMRAVMDGCWVLSADWMAQCLAADKIILPANMIHPSNSSGNTNGLTMEKFEVCRFIKSTVDDAPRRARLEVADHRRRQYSRISNINNNSIGNQPSSSTGTTITVEDDVTRFYSSLFQCIQGCMLYGQFPHPLPSRADCLRLLEAGNARLVEGMSMHQVVRMCIQNCTTSSSTSNTSLAVTGAETVDVNVAAVKHYLSSRIVIVCPDADTCQTCRIEFNSVLRETLHMKPSHSSGSSGNSTSTSTSASASDSVSVTRKLQYYNQMILITTYIWVLDCVSNYQLRVPNTY